MLEQLQIGFDIATSISIIGAAISFFISQRDSRELTKRQFAVSNLINFIKYIQEQKKIYDEIGNKLRKKALELGTTGLSTNNTSNNLLRDSNLETIFFLEDLKREISAQNSIYFPIFSPSGKTPTSLLECEAELDSLLNMARQEKYIEVTEKIEPYLIKIEKVVANELKAIMNSHYSSLP